MNGDTIEIVIAEETEPSTRCANCLFGYPDHIVDKLSALFNLGTGRTFNCIKCQHPHTTLTDFTTWVRPSAAKFLGHPDNVLNTTWFHVTDNPNWETDILNGGHGNKLPGDLMVHLGTKETSLALKEQRQIRNKVYDINTENWFLYEVELNPNTPVHHEVQVDMNFFPEHSKETFTEDWEWEPNGVTRYINAYEHPGTISLLANSSSFTVKSKTTL